MRPAQQVFVIERTHRAEQRPGNQEPDPFVSVEMHAFQPSGKRKPHERCQRRQHTNSFQQRRPLTQNQNCAKQRPKRASGANGRAQRQRQVFKREK